LNISAKNGTIDLIGNATAIRFSLKGQRPGGGRAERTGKAGQSRPAQTKEFLEKQKLLEKRDRAPELRKK
jgi:hypothetical protein